MANNNQYESSEAESSSSSNTINFAELAESRRVRAERLLAATSRHNTSNPEENTMSSPHNSINKENDHSSFEEEDYSSYRSRRLGSLDPDQAARSSSLTPDNVSQAQSQSEVDSQFQVQRERSLRIQAALLRVSRPIGEALVPSNSSHVSGSDSITSATPILRPARSTTTSTIDNTLSSSTTTESALFTLRALSLSSSSSNQINDLFAERKARIEEQQKKREIAERVREQRLRAEREAKRNAALTPKEKMEKEIKEKEARKIKVEQAAQKAEKARIKKNIEEDRQRRKEIDEANRQRHAREKAAQDAKKATELRAHMEMRKRMDEEEEK